MLAISKEWLAIKGEILERSCGYRKSNNLILQLNNIKLPAETVIELTELTKTCAPVKNKISTMLESGRYLLEDNSERI